MSNLSYIERCNYLNIDTLELRRARFDLIFVFKIIHGIIALNFNEFFAFPDSRTRGREHFSIKSLYVPKNAKISSFFTHRVVPVWNKLPPEVRTAPSLHSFKSLLYKLTYDQVVPNSLLRN